MGLVYYVSRIPVFTETSYARDLYDNRVDSISVVNIIDSITVHASGQRAHRRAYCWLWFNDSRLHSPQQLQCDYWKLVPCSFYSS